MTKEPLPPGQHPDDPWKSETDPVLFAVERLKTHLSWASEHYLTYLDDPNESSELDDLGRSLEDARRHLRRLAELLLAGQGVDPNKSIPRGLVRHDAGERDETD